VRTPASHSISIVVWLCIAILFHSCSSDTDNVPDEEVQGRTMLSLVVGGVRAEGNSSGEDYDVGSVSDCNIDFYGKDYRMYFFDSEDKYIGKCSETVASKETDDNTVFQLIGVVPDVMLEKMEFKIVVLANWGNNYNDDELQKGVTTINDLCEKSWSQFSCDANTTKEIIKGTRGIPFFGVRKFSGVTFTRYQKTTLTDPITLLRAMAKVEVLKKETETSDSYNITSVTLTNYNTKGYCAPLVTERSDYDHDYVWSEDFVKALHLVNDTESTDPLSFTEDNGKWVIYIPEYRNLTEDGTDVRSDGKEATIKVKFDFQKDKDDPYTLYFADYDENSEPGNRHNIERNNLYRYTLSFATHKLSVESGDWGGVFENEIEFKR